MPQPDVNNEPCRVCGAPQPVAQMQGHLNEAHHRDGGAPNPAPESKAWPPGSIETKAWPPSGIETK